jgi:hypothetical protein
MVDNIGVGVLLLPLTYEAKKIFEATFIIWISISATV